jgi:aminoglycoside 6'-N-acetyltransferase I
VADKFQIRAAQDSDISQWVAARGKLWPSSSVEYHHDELLRLRADLNFIAFIALNKHEELIGFCEASIRPYANGCDSVPVPFLEGCWVSEKFRRLGIGKMLLERVERWATELGFKELGSDSELENSKSQQAHLNWGFEETERVVYFRKNFRNLDNA